MTTTQFIWLNGSLVPWDDAKIHALTHALHYGSGVFEGIRCYNGARGTTIFRLQEHMDRFLYSASHLHMDVSYSRDQLVDACIETVRENNLEEGYIRPLLYYGYGKMGLNPIGAPIECMIACWPWGAYLASEVVHIKISDYIRIHPRSLQADAKISGHYVNSIMASLEVHGDDRYHEALLLDYEGNVAEGPGENLFMVKDGHLHTPEAGTILPGLTRDTIINLAAEHDITTVERTIHPDELFEADECFFTGTAAEVSGIGSINERTIGSGELGPITRLLRDAYLETVRGDRGHDEWLSFV